MSFDGFISYSHAADGRLAPAVQRGLHRLAKPWHRRRALWIFRDQTGLSVTPGLWSSIQKALDGSEWFVLLASPEAARSPWVNREIEYWIATKPADRILPVVTDGEWRWDTARGDLSADSTAVPDALRGVFAEEPLYLDLRWARDDRQLTLRHSEFRDAIAELAAPMHGVSKDELESEDVRQHRRARRLRRVAVAAVAVLTMVASGTGVLADQNADRADSAAVEAQRQQAAAAEQRSNAERFAEEARLQQENAERQEENARAQEARAHAAGAETRQQEKNAREQKAAAERATAEAERQQKNARRQQELADRSRELAEEQQAVAREQEKLAQQSAKETNRQRIIAEQQQRLAEEAGAEADRQRRVARQQQRMAEEATAEARQQKAIAQENERKADAAAAEARRQERNAAEQKQITVGRRLFNQAKATITNDPATALRLGVAAQQILPGAEARSELAGLAASTRRLGTIADALYTAYGPGDVVAVVDSDFDAFLWNTADRANPARIAKLNGFLFTSPPVFSPDGRTLAISGDYGLVPHLYDVSDPAHPTLISTVPEEMGKWVTFGPDGKTLGVVDSDGVWSLWDLADRARPTLLTRQSKGNPVPLTFSPDGRTAVIAGAPGTVWDITDRTRPTEVGTLAGNWVRATVNPKRALLATTDKEGTLALWHLDDPADPQRIFSAAARANDAKFSTDGLTLVTSDIDGMVRLWDMTEDAPVHMVDLNDHSGFPAAMSFSPDGRSLATVGTVGTLSLWSVRAPGEPEAVGLVGGSIGQGLTAALSADGRRLTAVDTDGMATVWDVANPASPVALGTTRLYPGHIAQVAVSPDGNMIASVGEYLGSLVRLTDISNPAAPEVVVEFPGGPPDGAMTFSPDGRTLAVDIGGHTVALWDLTAKYRPDLISLLEGSKFVGGVEYSPDGRTIAVAEERSTTLWDVTDQSEPVRLATLKGHSDEVLAMAFSPDGRMLATGGADRAVTVWNIEGKPRRQAILTGNAAAVWSVAFTPDSRTLAVGAKDEKVVIWDVAEQTWPIRMASLRRTDLKSETLLFHADGRTLVSAGGMFGTKRAALWDYAGLTRLRADPVATACAVAGEGLSQEEWTAYIPEAPHQPTCAR